MHNEFENEIWVEIFDYPTYSISTEGRVKNNKSGKILKPQTNSSGYLHIIIRNETRVLTKTVHRLVAEHFLPMSQNPKRIYVNHLDGVKSNNALRNLEWVSASENIKHSYAIGLREKQREKSRLQKAKLSEIDIRNIRQRYQDGESQTSIAGSFNVSQSNVHAVVHGRSWTNIQ